MAKLQWVRGKVRWFDELKGEGLVRDEKGNSYYVHYSAIDSDKPRKTLKKDTAIKFQLLEDFHYVQVAKVKEV